MKLLLNSIAVLSLSSIAFNCLTNSAYAEMKCDSNGSCCNIVRTSNTTSMTCSNPNTGAFWSEQCNSFSTQYSCRGLDQQGNSWMWSCNRVGNISFCSGTDSDGNFKTWQQ